MEKESAQKDPYKLLHEFVTAREKINSIGKSLVGGSNLIRPISLNLPDVSVPIHGFYTTISWLYVTYFEAGTITISFLMERACRLESQIGTQLSRHKSLVHSFRTFLQHNLNFTNNHDIAKKEFCANWIFRLIKQQWPSSNDQWKIALAALLIESNVFIKHILGAALSIADDDNKSTALRILRSRLQRQLSGSEYDGIISEAAYDMGMTSIDPSMIRRQHIGKWNRNLQLLREGSDFRYEARRLVEQAILNEEKAPLAIIGKDIILGFGIAPGIKVKKLLETAQKISADKPMGRLEIMAELQKYKDRC